jgi:hypothetical protein
MISLKEKEDQKQKEKFIRQEILRIEMEKQEKEKIK